MGKIISKIRTEKMKAQSGLCHYCRQPMWSDNLAVFCKRFRLSLKRGAKFRCTAEHLHAKSEGGKDTSKNIVAACWFCNQHRHFSKRPLDPDAFATKVRKRLAAG